MLETGEGLPVGTERHVQEKVPLGRERQTVLVSELPEIAPLPATEFRFARSGPEPIEQNAELAGVVGFPGGQGEVRARGVNRPVERLLGGNQAGIGFIGLAAGRSLLVRRQVRSGRQSLGLFSVSA